MNLKDYYIDFKRLEDYSQATPMLQNMIEIFIHRFLEFDISNSERKAIIVKTLIKHKILIKDSCGNCDCTTNESCGQSRNTVGLLLLDDQNIENKPQQVTV